MEAVDASTLGIVSEDGSMSLSVQKPSTAIALRVETFS
jgi:hypothetical protein